MCGGVGTIVTRPIPLPILFCGQLPKLGIDTHTHNFLWVFTKAWSDSFNVKWPFLLRIPIRSKSIAILNVIDLCKAYFMHPFCSTCLYKLPFSPILICIFDQTAEEAMTPIESTFSLDVNSKLDWWVSWCSLVYPH